MLRRPLVAWLLALAFAACNGLPPECVALWRRMPDNGEQWSDEELRAYARDAFAYSESDVEWQARWHALLYVQDACRRGGSVEVGNELLGQVVDRYFEVAEDEERPWTLLLIGLGNLWRSESDARAEADAKLRLLDRIEARATSPFVRAVVPHRKTRLYMTLEQAGLLRDDDEHAEALRQLGVLEERRGALDSYWGRNVDSLTAGARARLLATRVGMVAPALAGETLRGDAFDLRSTRGKVTLVYFYGFW